QTQGAGRCCAQALLLADRLALLDVPTQLRQELARDPVHRLLMAIALGELLQPVEPTKRPFGTAIINLTLTLLRPGWRFRFSEAVRQVRQVAYARLAPARP